MEFAGSSLLSPVHRFSSEVESLNRLLRFMDMLFSLQLLYTMKRTNLDTFPKSCISCVWSGEKVWMFLYKKQLWILLKGYCCFYAFHGFKFCILVLMFTVFNFCELPRELRLWGGI